MVIVRLRKMGRDKGGRILHQRLFIGLGNKIVAVIGIRITDALERCLRLPGYRSLGIEIMLAANDALGNFLKIVGSLQFARQKGFVLQIAAIAVNLHLADIGEACLAHYLFGKLMKTGFADSDLRPSA